jgi:hypothetical protein
MINISNYNHRAKKWRLYSSLLIYAFILATSASWLNDNLCVLCELRVRYFLTPVHCVHSSPQRSQSVLFYQRQLV